MIHVSSVIGSGALFVVRGIWMLRGSTMLDRRWVKVAPHIIDTVLLVSAIALVVMVRQYPFVHAWLTAKVIALVIYIIAGSVALKRGRTKGIRATAFVFAMIVFAYIVMAAVTHSAGAGVIG